MIGQELFEAGPVWRDAEHGVEPADGILHRPKGQSPRPIQPVDAPAFRRPQVRCDQRGQVQGQSAAIDLGMVLRHAAREHILPERRASAEPHGEQTDLREHAEAIGQGLGGDGTVFHFLLIGGEQQARFQPCQPRRHHQPIGREFQSHPFCTLDHGQELFDQRQDRDFRQIDFLRAGEVEQQIQRPLEAVEPQEQAVARRGWVRRFGRHADRGLPA